MIPGNERLLALCQLAFIAQQKKQKVNLALEL